MTRPAVLQLVTPCSCCGMEDGPGLAYHPYAACLMFKETHSSEATQMNLAAVVQYGMNAQKAGVTLEQALANVNSVLFREDSPLDSRSLEERQRSTYPDDKGFTWTPGQS